ncbi:hypothetical protein [Desulfovibrio sp. SGI.169]|uniref:hypothetical protein n=1 Tax=Desulfovibrio sp. SGI.169 TaxID=3420561 RepID=UPI003D00D5E6
MAKMTRITIPYKPRYSEVHDALESHRFSVLVAHRRFGKTVLVINHLIKMATLCDKPRGVFAYVGPLRNQAKNVAWDYLKHYTAPLPGRVVNESELMISIPSRGNGAKVRIFGADNPDSLRGLYFDGVVLDEVAQMKPEVWEEVVRPALADRNGWAVFIGTPKGVNLFSEQYYKAVSLQTAGDSEWYAASYPVTATNVLPASDVEDMRRELSDNAFRQEMLCDFSASSDDVLIALPLIDEAQGRNYKPVDYEFSPLVLGVDVARFGDDASVLFFRQGLVAFEPVVLRKTDNMALADRIALEMRQRDPAAVFIDSGGGAGVIDRLRQLGQTVMEVPFGGRPRRAERFINRRMEMWQEMKDWLVSGGALPPDEALKAELSAPTYSFDNKGLLKLERKEDIKERLGRSTDLADALALTFAAPVAAPALKRGRVKTAYNPLEW